MGGARGSLGRYQLEGKSHGRDARVTWTVINVGWFARAGRASHLDGNKCGVVRTGGTPVSRGGFSFQVELAVVVLGLVGCIEGCWSDERIVMVDAAGQRSEVFIAAGFDGG